MGDHDEALSLRQEADDDPMAVARKLIEQAQALMEAHASATKPATAKRRRKKDQRVKTAHRGVKVVARSRGAGAVSYVARWRDPDPPHAWEQVSLDALGYTTPEARAAWAVKKSEWLMARRRELAAGGVPHSNREVHAAVQDYIDHSEKTKRPGTVEAMRPALARFVEWSEKRGLATTDDVRPHDLAAFREDMAAASAMDQVKGAKRGTRRATDKRLSPVSVNSYLKAVKGCLNWLRRTGKLAHVASGEQVKEAMGSVAVPKEEPEFLHAPQVRALLAACLAHDEARWALTREEHDGDAAPGTTPKHTAIAPFVCFVLLTGCRVGEALSLEWSEVNLDALDSQGRPIGAVTVLAEKCKTRATRAVTLDVSPGLRGMLTSMRDALRAKDRAPVGRVFPEHSESSLKRAVERLVRPAPGPGARQRAAGYGAPAFGWHTLRRTAGTHLVCAPSIYGAASVHLAARQLGHSVEVAQQSYSGRVLGIPHGLTTLDAVLGIEAELAEVTRRIGGKPAAEPARAVAL